eukprot:910054_1
METQMTDLIQFANTLHKTVENVEEDDRSDDIKIAKEQPPKDLAIEHNVTNKNTEIEQHLSLNETEDLDTSNTESIDKDVDHVETITDTEHTLVIDDDAMKIVKETTLNDANDETNHTLDVIEDELDSFQAYVDTNSNRMETEIEQNIASHETEACDTQSTSRDDDDVDREDTLKSTDPITNAEHESETNDETNHVLDVVDDGLYALQAIDDLAMDCNADVTHATDNESDNIDKEESEVETTLNDSNDVIETNHVQSIDEDLSRDDVVMADKTEESHANADANSNVMDPEIAPNANGDVDMNPTQSVVDMSCNHNQKEEDGLMYLNMEIVHSDATSPIDTVISDVPSTLSDMLSQILDNDISSIHSTQLIHAVDDQDIADPHIVFDFDEFPDFVAEINTETEAESIAKPESQMNIDEITALQSTIAIDASNESFSESNVPPLEPTPTIEETTIKPKRKRRKKPQPPDPLPPVPALIPSVSPSPHTRKKKKKKKKKRCTKDDAKPPQTHSNTNSKGNTNARSSE